MTAQMSPAFCPECHQRLPKDETVDGVRLTKFKAKLFELVKRQPGMSARELAREVYQGEIRVDQARAIRAHVSQTNVELELGNARVRLKGHPYGGYRVVKLP